MKPELRLRTIDHPEANGRSARQGEHSYQARFPLEDGRELVLQMGERGFRQTTDLLLDMVTGAEPHNDGSTNLPGADPKVSELIAWLDAKGGSSFVATKMDVEDFLAERKKAAEKI